MTNWKKWPHLFTNRKFTAKDLEGQEWRVFATHEQMNGFVLHADYEKPLTLDYELVTLVARPISDLNEGEFINYDNLMGPGNEDGDIDNWKASLSKRAKARILYTKELVWLLNRGVYPFDQKDFNNDDLEERHVKEE